MYLGGAVCGDGSTYTEIRRRIQAGASAWREVEEVMGDRNISRKVKGKVLMHNTSLPIRPRDHCDDRKKQERLKVCENNWMRRTAGVKRIDKRGMKESREEVSVKESFTRELVRSRLRWAEHVERMEGVRLTKRADALGVEGRRRRGRPRLRWEDCVKRDLVEWEGNGEQGRGIEGNGERGRGIEGSGERGQGIEGNGERGRGKEGSGDD